MTMESLALAAVMLLAVLVGMAIPVILQLRATLKSAQAFLDSTSTRVDTILKEVSAVTARVNKMADEIEGTGQRAAKLIESLEPAAQSVENLRHTLKMAAAIGPAAFAAVRSFVSSIMARRAEQASASADEEPAPEDPYAETNEPPRPTAAAG